MRSKRTVSLAAALLVMVTAYAAGPAIPAGRYEGSIDLGEGRSTPIALRLLEEGGGLVDLAGQDLYSYPLERVSLDGERLVFTLGAGTPGAIRFEATAVDAEGGRRLEGQYSQGAGKGPFSMVLKAPDESAGRESAVAVRGGRLHGSLLLPADAGASPLPLVVIVPGAGTTDRDGNNYTVPGRNDGPKALALALAAAGVASYRYDKRGAGESYTLAGAEEDSRFSDYVEDAVAVASAFMGESRFSRVVLAGHNEGGLVAAAAALELERAGRRVDGLALLCATGKTGVESVEESLADIPGELRPEAAAIMAALRDNKRYDNPSAYFAEFFRPSFQPWLASWFTFDVRAIVAAVRAPLVLVQGDRDFQISLADFALLAKARPDAPAFVVPAMNHVLKAVPPDLDENYRSFSDPSFALAPGLAEIVASLAKGIPWPAGLPRFDGGVQVSR